MPSPEATWIRTVDLAFVDRRFGASNVNQLLRESMDYAEPPFRIDDAGRLVVMLAPPQAPRPSGRAAHEYVPEEPTRLVLRVRPPSELEMGCSCSRGKSYVCRHVSTALVDLAVHPGLREALATGGPVAPRVAELRKMRIDAFEERTLDERLAHWLPGRKFETDFEIDIEVARSTGLTSPDQRPVILMRHRRPPSRTLMKARDVQEARLAPRHRRLVELTVPSSAHRDALLATRAQASLLIKLLRDESPIFTRNFKSHFRVADSLAAPRVEPTGDRLVARWYSAEGRPLCDSENALLFAGPFPYLWSIDHELFHTVAPDVDLDLAWGLQVVPSLPLRKGTAAQIGLALLDRGRGLGVKLPPPEVFGLPPLEAPSFTLRLEGTPLDVRAELRAVYSAGPMTVSPGTIAHGGGRDVDAEERALALLHDAGLRVNDAGGIVADDETAVDFWQRGILALEASTTPHFEILFADSLVRAEVGPAIDVRIDATATAGWLDVNLMFSAGILKVEMAAIRLALAERRQWVALSDGTLTKISDKVAALVGEVASAFEREGFDADARVVHGRLPPHQLGRIERWVREHGGTIDERVADLARRLHAPAALGAETKFPSNLQATLRPYQRSGLAWLQLLRELGAGGILADDMGLGKTLMTLALLSQWKEDDGRLPSLVVCPTSLVGNWEREAKRFTPDLDVLVLQGDAAHRTRAASTMAEHDLVVTTYGLLRRDIERLASMPFRAVILDEAQNVKNAGAATTHAARGLLAQLRLALSGTPVENRLSELWSIMSFVNPGMLGTRSDFEDRFERPISLRPDGAVAERLRAVVRPFVLRRTKKEVLDDLPPKTEIDRVCVFGVHQRRLYDALALAVREAVRTNIERRGLARSRLSVLTAILRLRQMACDPRLVDPTVPAEHSAKRAAFLDLARELVAEGRRALVFSQFVELLGLWREDLEREKIAYEYLDGSTTHRDAVVDRFQNGTAPLFLISLKAGGAGLNLTAADTVIHCDPWWNPAAEDQATDRAHRIGQKRAVTVVRLFARGTIEEKIAMLKKQKREIADTIVGAMEAGALDARATGELDGFHDEMPAPERAPELDAKAAALAVLEAEDVEALLYDVRDSDVFFTEET